ncbi:MAG: sulfatase [Cytophagales bacterium]|nr:sulfatase [Cytophagales bacterium]
MRCFRWLLTLLIASTLWSCTQQPVTDRPPNFIVIFADDMGYGDIGSFGHPTIQTPHLDRMVREGQKWTQFYVAAPVCTPSRAALLTGRYPIRNGMTSKKKGVLFPNSAGGLPQSEVTIAEVLKQKDYATAAIGKWHLGHLPQFLPMKQGFDQYYGIPYSNDMNATVNWSVYGSNVSDPRYQATTDMYNVPLFENEKVIERPANQHTITRRYTEKALEFIEKKQEEPFFLYLAQSLPHIPLFVHEDFHGSSKQGLYGDVIQEIDWSVGKILRKLEELALDQHTIVVFTSDNGPWLAFKTHGGSAGPLRAGKGTTFEGGQRVPAIFWGPGNVEPGVVHEMGSTLDLIQTFAAMSGTKVPHDRKMDGFDLSSVLSGESTIGPRNEFFFWTGAELYAARVGPWKLHIRQTAPITYWNRLGLLDEPELYNLEADIAEKYDLADENQDLVEQLQERLRLHKADITDPLPDNLAATLDEEF